MFAPIKAHDNTENPLMGQFQEKQHGHWFEYRQNKTDRLGAWADLENFPHEVFVNDKNGYDTRAARVLKTVVYIAVDENPDGSPVVEKWDIKKHNQYKGG